jgi:hypothetical protein
MGLEFTLNIDPQTGKMQVESSWSAQDLYELWARQAGKGGASARGPRVRQALKGLTVSDLGENSGLTPRKELRPEIRERLAVAAEVLREVVDTEEAEFVSWMAAEWSSDMYVLLGKYPEALELQPMPDLGVRGTAAVYKAWCLRYAARLPPTAREFLTMFSKSPTAWGRRNIEDLNAALHALLFTRYPRGGLELFDQWVQGLMPGEWGLIVLSGRVGTLLPSYSFDRAEGAAQTAHELIREAENILRKRGGLPAVGEGYIAETALYHSIRSAFPALTVRHRAQPGWLGRQHLDVLVPDLALAFEYQGEQHDRPVEFFGGESTFLQQQERDRRKRRLCELHGVRLVEVRDGYDPEEIVDFIEARIREVPASEP